MTSPRTTEQLAERFRAQHTVGDECWLWTGKVGRDGYGRFSVKSRWHMAHRWVYEHTVGPIPDRLEIDHLCQVKLCVNPLHLEAVTRRENMHRQPRIAARMAQTECKRGHPFTEANTGRDSRGNRFCRACHAAGTRAYKAAKRAARRSGAEA